MAYPLYLPGEPAPPEARPLYELPLLVLVGLTGVGKTSLLEALGYPTLPDRRELADRYVFPRYGYTEPPQDRSERFALTRRFRQEHPGGVAEILAQSRAVPAWPLLFDGLRGADEVRFALEHLPGSYFVVLEARDLTRLSRLLRRGDAFDRVRLEPTDQAALSELARGVLSEAELQEALSWGVPPQELTAKLKIVAEERKNYDPAGSRRVLWGHPRALFLDTEALDIAQEAAAIRALVERVHA
ncbi:MAG: hypothetical protein NZN28_11385 [Meiothermus sp.]|uniref:hypothetical protein n=1 Tax=Meiothermus sp. TaxID=1955249 RepID=UPI0025FDE543|nr:hypothetical protein [Meiothermus sp.]MCS7069215.1 hypothetical protein [Meiothermus sp.]